MARRSVLLAFSLALSAGCGGAAQPAGGGEPATAAAPSPVAEEGPGAACLADATAERTPPADAPDEVEVAHILVRHSDLKAPRGATRSRGEACLRALAALKALQGGGDWEDVVGEYSDAASATAGELGTVEKDEIDPSFGAAAFSLQPEQLSYVVESERGFHIILRRQ